MLNGATTQLRMNSARRNTSRTKRTVLRQPWFSCFCRFCAGALGAIRVSMPALARGGEARSSAAGLSRLLALERRRHEQRCLGGAGAGADRKPCGAVRGGAGPFGAAGRRGERNPLRFLKIGRAHV